jgi:hypothetical protein
MPRLCGSIPISSFAYDREMSQVGRKPEDHVDAPRLAISICRRVGVDAPLPVITGTAPV